MHGHFSRSSGLAKTIYQSTVRGGGGGKRRQGNRRIGGKTTSENGQAWSSPSPRGQWRTKKNKKKLEEIGCEVVCGGPTTSVVKG